MTGWGHRRLAGLVLTAVLAAAGCSGGDGEDTGRGSTTPASVATPVADASTTAPTTTPAVSFASRLCDGGAPRRLGQVDDPALAEASGLVASHANPGVLWAIADSGSPARLVAIDLTGATVATVDVSGAENVDWEDIALLRGPDRLVVADTGDNDGVRDTVALVVVPEPDLTGASPDAPLALEAGADRLELAWPDGARDAEAVLTDPIRGDIVVLSKHLLGGSEVMAVPADAAVGQVSTLAQVGELRTGLGEAVTGGDVSADGSTVVLRTYLSVLVFDRPSGSTLAQALTGTPCEARAPAEGQGEALALLADGTGAVTLSEGSGEPLWLVPAGP